ncbi:hypothetical protein Q1M64_12570 (plasmid) [Sinorhizobium meliloti]|nr:hypothetical protein Q1M63_13975 [Sinorhizobium meliloti]WKL39782.1 hypothetical protein Q1M64_12570 [Sinorhizobium meliloti]
MAGSIAVDVLPPGVDEEDERQRDNDDPGKSRPGVHDVKADEGCDHHGGRGAVLVGKVAAPQAGIHRLAQF